MSRILVVDDKEMMRDSVGTTLTRRGHTVVTAGGGKAALEKLQQRRIDVVVTDLQMPEMDGLDLLREIRGIDETLPVVFMTAYGTVDTAVNAMKEGAYDYITKPFSGDELCLAVERAIDHHRLLRENQLLRATSPNAEATPAATTFIGSGPAMQGLRERMGRIAASHGTVLITGPSGVGKEVAARCIHEQSPRSKQPFLAVNCAALSTSLLESELFGHEKGAFTGADRLRKGRFELADGGTLLLDEISEVAPSIQAKLLRVLQEQCFERVGSSRTLPVDVRVIATTNRNLAEEVKDGRFRQDLFFRLNVLPLAVPPLRDRLEDVPDLATHFLARIAEREGRTAKQLEPRVFELFRQYAWPGNVRELQNICERAAVLSPGDRIDAARIAPWLQAEGTSARPMPAAGRLPAAAGLRPMAASTMEAKPVVHELLGIVCDGQVTLGDIEREAIVATLQHHGGHRQRSARALGIGVRTLGLKLKKWKEQKIVAQTL
ncbi:MAG: sigma-54-dependent Fis family transcriptional regulator [Phycisphaerales bacterium]|nr:sigma-54 dependent transcriptional regulator [Phycisphaerae bacterium]NNF44748.1 sigma-54-dependent Fis family transcriptional regulator [Phycisphaerales bacterium]NNM26954.1 sigma-54-dependent Fis family transcriptional regulator [Phycisphaerales bacterium]